MTAPYRGEDDACRVCGSPPESKHDRDCWLWATICYMRAYTEPDDELTQWWVELARTEAAKVVPKAIEYGATDLADIGQQLVDSGVGSDQELAPSTEAKAELGVFFYLVGKMARWKDAVASGRRVSDDTLHDIGVYVRMAQRIREAGSWPGVELKGS